MSCKSAVLISLTLLASLSFAGEVGQQTDDVRLLFTGDIMLSRQVRAELEGRRLSPWQGFKALFSGADWIAGNLEGAVGPPSNCTPHGNSPCFDISDNLIGLLRDAGFQGLSVENNHSGDLGHAGRNYTEQVLLEKGILPFTFESSPRFLRLKGITVAVIAISVVPSADGVIEAVPSTNVRQKLRLARQLANLVVVSIHWGSQLLDWSSADQRREAEWLIANGADLILGHHPHVVQSPECVRGKPVFFSLGNHVFDQKYSETKTGLIADCRVSGGKLACSGLRTHTPPNSSIPELLSDADENLPVPELMSCVVGLSPSLKMSGVEIRPQPWSIDQPQGGLILGGWKGESLKWLSRRQDVISLEVGYLAGAGPVPVIFTLERHCSPLDREKGVRPYVYGVGPRGLIAKWRGSALAWPLLDAALQRPSGMVCALHRGDSFVTLNAQSEKTRVAAYRWNGFGFDGVSDPVVISSCAEQLNH